MVNEPENRGSTDGSDDSALVDVMGRRLRRRTVLGGAAGAIAGVVGAGVLANGASAASKAPASHLVQSDQATPAAPADMAPAGKQVFVAPDDASTAKVLDFYESVYQRPSNAASDLFSEPLVRLDKDFNLQPAGAESWSGSSDGMTWTFKIRQGMVWSDGNPVTANDWVSTIQYGADPNHAWDFTWYFQGIIKGWNDAIAGKISLDELGVHTGTDDYELIVETEVPAPYLPAMLLYSNPLSKAALASTGPLYNTKPETAVSSGPFILTEWAEDQQITYSKNDKYNGTLTVPVETVQIPLSTPANFFTMYQNDEIDFMQNPDPASLKIMMDDPKTAKEVYSGVGDFPTWYVFFDVTKAPFTDLKVRQAWSHAVDRDTLKTQVLGPNGTPAYSWLAPGFPASNRDGLKSIQDFDPDKAKQLLSDAGFPDGKGFPKLQMWLRAPSPLDETVAGAVAAMLKQNLNIDVELLDKSSEEFTAALNAKPTQILLGYVRYGMDFFDPFNMLSVWLTGGRHSYSDPKYDAAVKAAGSFLGPTDQRIKMFQDAEKILVEDVPAVFIYHGTPVQFIKPWVTGKFLDADKNGIVAMHWPGYATMSTVPQELYLNTEVPDRS